MREMKEFLKWWTKECETNIGKRFATPRMLAEEGWKAALEWVKDDEESYCCGDWDDSEGEYHECLKTVAIKEELKELNDSESKKEN